MSYTPDSADLRECGVRYPDNSAEPQTVGKGNEQWYWPGDGVPDVLGSLILTEQESAGPLSLRMASTKSPSPWKKRLAVSAFVAIDATVLGAFVIFGIDPTNANRKAPNFVRGGPVGRTAIVIPQAPPRSEPGLREEHAGALMVRQHELAWGDGERSAAPDAPDQPRDNPGQVGEQEPAADPIKDQLEKAKARYCVEIDKIKTEVQVTLEKKIPGASKKKRTTGTMEALTAEMRAFGEDVNNIPPSLGRNRRRFARRIKSARDELAQAFALASWDYTRTGQAVRASAVRTEQEEFWPKRAANLTDLSPRDRFVEPNLVFPVPVIPPVLIRSEWNFNRRAGGLNQGGAFKILDGVIYHVNTPEPVGLAAVDGAGGLHLSFRGHRKIDVGEATAFRLAPGEWRGTLEFLDIVWEFQMSRR